MNLRTSLALGLVFAILVLGVKAHHSRAQNSSSIGGPSSEESPVPPIKTSMKPMPGVEQLLTFADKFLLKKNVERRFDQMPTIANR